MVLICPESGPCPGCGRGYRSDPENNEVDDSEECDALLPDARHNNKCNEESCGFWDRYPKSVEKCGRVAYNVLPLVD